MTRANFSTYVYARLEEMSDKSDLSFWRNQSDSNKFNEAWRLVVQAAGMQGIKESELRLQRSVATFQRQSS